MNDIKLEHGQVWRNRGGKLVVLTQRTNDREQHIFIGTVKENGDTWFFCNPREDEHIEGGGKQAFRHLSTEDLMELVGKNYESR